MNLMTTSCAPMMNDEEEERRGDKKSVEDWRAEDFLVVLVYF